MKNFDLKNLPFDPAVEAGKAVEKWRLENLATDPAVDAGKASETRYETDDPNRPETEEDGIRAGALRILRFQHQSRGFRGKTGELLETKKDSASKTE